MDTTGRHLSTEPSSNAERAGPEVTERPAASERPSSDSMERSQPGSKPKAKGGAFGFVRELPFLLIVAFALALLIKTFLVQAFFIPSESMQNTL
ncbi:MAG TPA: signal peptidase I, partial [Actinomycetota bacterium]|nr:signal peptidase I [Actinomycetota bacterium]